MEDEKSLSRINKIKIWKELLEKEQETEEKARRKSGIWRQKGDMVVEEGNEKKITNRGNRLDAMESVEVFDKWKLKV